jgi:hypothetical protein
VEIIAIEGAFGGQFEVRDGLTSTAKEAIGQAIQTNQGSPSLSFVIELPDLGGTARWSVDFRCDLAVPKGRSGKHADVGVPHLQITDARQRDFQISNTPSVNNNLRATRELTDQELVFICYGFIPGSVRDWIKEQCDKYTSTLFSRTKAKIAKNLVFKKVGGELGAFLLGVVVWAM